MMPSKKRRVNGDLVEFILLILYKDGPQSKEQLEEKTVMQVLNFDSGILKRHYSKSGDNKQLNVTAVCENLLSRNWIKLDTYAKYELTDSGQTAAEQIHKAFEGGAHRLETKLLSPSAVARNTTICYAIGSVLKMTIGLISGSVGLIADGADTIVATAASGIVWAGIKFKKEVIGTLTIIGLLFLAAVILLYHSFLSISHVLAGTFQPMTMPYLVITVELISILIMYALSIYQRFVGKRHQNLALISLSIDSKNAVYSAVVVIIGAICALFGIYWVDAIIGIIIAIRISIDGINLIRDTAKTMQGEKIDFSKFELPFEKQINQRRTNNFQHWILYTIHKNKLSTKKEIVTSVEKTFRHSYLPSVFTARIAGKDVNFEANFDELITPLINAEYLTEENPNCYKLTDQGTAYIKNIIDTIRHK
jgi:cation diffusion facilitator family transporter